MPSSTTEVAALVWHPMLSCWRSIKFLSQQTWPNSLFQPLLGLHISLGVAFCTLDHILLVNDISLVPVNGKHAFFSRRLSFQLFYGTSGVTTVTGFSFPGLSDTPNSHHLRQCCTKNNYPCFPSQWVITDVLQSCSLHFRHELTWHPPSTHVFLTQTCNNSTDTNWTNMQFFHCGSPRNSLIFLNKSGDLLPAQIMSCSVRPSREQLVIQVQISATISWFSHPTTHSTYVHSIFTIKSQK